MATPKGLAIPQLQEILKNHTPTGNAIRAIVEWINKNVTPTPGNKVEKT